MTKIVSAIEVSRSRNNVTATVDLVYGRTSYIISFYPIAYPDQSRPYVLAAYNKEEPRHQIVADSTLSDRKLETLLLEKILDLRCRAMTPKKMTPKD